LVLGQDDTKKAIWQLSSFITATVVLLKGTPLRSKTYNLDIIVQGEVSGIGASFCICNLHYPPKSKMTRSNTFLEILPMWANDQPVAHKISSNKCTHIWKSKTHNIWISKIDQLGHIKWKDMQEIPYCIIQEKYTQN
jgi:hypothetical protein